MRIITYYPHIRISSYKRGRGEGGVVGALLLSATAPDLGHVVAPLHCHPWPWAWLWTKLVEVMEFHLTISNPERWCSESAALNIPANLEHSAVATGLEKVTFYSNPKECSNYHTIALISQASKVMLKILQPGFSNMSTMNFQMFKLVLEKAEESEIKLPTSAGSSKKQESSRKTSISALLTMPKPLTVWVIINGEKLIKLKSFCTARETINEMKS